MAWLYDGLLPQNVSKMFMLYLCSYQETQHLPHMKHTLSILY